MKPEGNPSKYLGQEGFKQQEQQVQSPQGRSGLGASPVITTLVLCPLIAKTSLILSFKTYLGGRNTESAAEELTD